MKLATPKMIPIIDKYANEVLGIPSAVLMYRSAESVMMVLKEIYPEFKKILILSGKGNNGGDGYALACLCDGLETVICDVFSSGQRTEEGKYWLKEAKAKGINIIDLQNTDLYSVIEKADIIVDGIFGTGFMGEPPEELSSLVFAVNSSKAKKIAIDVPLGVNSEDGSVCRLNIPADVTVTLSYPKPGLFSYPARGAVGKIVNSGLGLDSNAIENEFEFNDYLVDSDEAKLLLPDRKTNSNKGCFGKTLVIAGSDAYRGAAHLTLEAALRGGCGIVRFAGDEELCTELRMKLPEAIYHKLSLSDKEAWILLSEQCQSVMVGSGSSVSLELFRLVEFILENADVQLVIDADALNSIAAYSSPEIFAKAKRKPILTPHPLELSRLSGVPVAEIEAHRLSFAKNFALKYNCILFLKGASTIVTDGKTTYINSSGGSSLAKGGSGDALAGLIASLTAFAPSAIKAAALAAYVHGRAGDNLAQVYSSFGVTPSDLPREMAKILSEIEKNL